MERLSGHDDTVDGCVEVLQPKSIPDQMLLKVLESNMQGTVCFSQHFSPHNTKYTPYTQKKSFFDFIKMKQQHLTYTKMKGLLVNIIVITENMPGIN